MYQILVMTPVGRTDTGQQIDYFPSRWSGGSGAYKVNSFYPYNLAYLTAILKRDTSHSVRMIDANYYGVDSSEYIELVHEISPDILIVEIDSIIFAKQIMIFNEIKNLLPNIKIIACGPHLTANPEEGLNTAINYIALGEFEFSIPRFINSDFDASTPGIFPNGKAPLVDINSLPFPENSDIKRRDYCRLYGSEYNEIELFATRGCPVMCNFCVVTNVYYSKPNYRTRKVESILDEIRMLMYTIPNLQGIFFNEESHTINRNFLRELCEGLIESGINKKLKFNCMANYDTLDREILMLMKEAGYYKIRIGIESLDQESMKLISKSNLKSSNNKLIGVLEACQSVGISVYGTMTIGAAGSSYEKDCESLLKIENLHAEGLIQEFSLSINTPMRGTPFYEECIANGWLIEEASHFDGAYGSIVNFDNYSSEQMNEAFAFGTSVRNKLNQLNESMGITYSSYDREWCAPVFNTTNRQKGQGII